MWRQVKLLLNLLITAVVFNYFITSLILILNPYTQVQNRDFVIMFLNLFLYYGPLWLIVSGVLFFVLQFFSEKKYPIGLITPPTLTYFLSFTVLVITIILYFNYDYYFDFFPHFIRSKLIKVLVVNLLLIITGIIFIFIRKVTKKWIQLLFLGLLAFNILSTYTSIVEIHQQYQTLDTYRRENFTQQNITRKIRIVIMDGLSLDYLLSLSSEQKLPNFNLIVNQGVRGKITPFKPNLDLALLNSALTGLPPSQFPQHSNYKFKISNLDIEFDKFPKYIFFRTSTSLKLTAIYKKPFHRHLDHINRFYTANKYRTKPLINLEYIDPYSEKSLHRNSSFLQKFSDLLKQKDSKYEVLKKSFFRDDYLKNIDTNLKETDYYYSIIYFPGLKNISRFFYQYSMPDVFGNISEASIKKYGSLFEKYYEYYDSIIGNLITSTGEDELLVILSFFEYEPLPLWRRILVNIFSKKDIYVYNPLDSEGTILMYEKKALKQDYPLKNITISDIFPTLLYYAGFRLPKYLPGEVIREIFTDEFVLNNPIDIDTN